MATNKRTGIMLAYPLEERRLANPKFGWEPPYIVQPKLDGERGRNFVANGHSTLVSSTEELVTGVPHITDALAFVRKHIKLPELDGELYCHGLSFDEIHSIVSRKYESTLHPDHMQIKYHIFDVITNEVQLERTLYLRDTLADVFADCPFIEVVPSFLAQSYEEVIDYYNRFISEGYEGIIVREKLAPYVRKRSTKMLKFKEKRRDDYRVVRLIEAISADGTPLGMTGAVRCVDEMGTEFNVGAGHMTHEARKRTWVTREDFCGGWCKVGYQNLTAKEKVPRHGLCVTLTLSNRGE